MSDSNLPATTDGQLPEAVIAELREARTALTERGIADRLTELVGAPVTASLQLLPDSAERLVYSAVEKALQTALDVAVNTMGRSEQAGGKPRLLAHKVLAGLSGAAGGAFGGVTIAAELPVSTVLILRSVADIARSQGEDLDQVEARLACLQVFALDPGKKTVSGKKNDPSKASDPDTTSDVDDDTEVGYFAVRIAMGKQIRSAAEYVARHGLANKTAPPLVQLLNTIGKRFGVVVGEKLAAQAIPVIGAVGGALINSYFIDHYQDLARAHFTIRRLERQYGADVVAAAYQGL